MERGGGGGGRGGGGILLALKNSFILLSARSLPGITLKSFICINSFSSSVTPQALTTSTLQENGGTEVI